MTVKELKEYKGDRTADLNRDLSEFEKNFILITGGILAFSITFIKDIVKLDEAIYIQALFIGWALTAIAMGIMMFTWQYSSNASHKLWIIADDFINRYSLFDDTMQLSAIQVGELKTKINDYYLPVKRKLNRFRNSAIVIFLLGLLSLSIFIGYNLTKENHAKPPAKSGKYYIVVEKDSIKINLGDSIILTNHK